MRQPLRILLHHSDPHGDMEPVEEVLKRLLVGRKCRWPPKRFSLRLGAFQTGLGALDQQIALELRNGVDHPHRQLARRAGQVNVAESEAVNTYAHLFQPGHGGADVDSIPAEPVQLGNDQHITPFHLVQQPAEPFATGDGHRPGYGFCDNAVRLHPETRRFNLLTLVFRSLLCGRDPGMGQPPRTCTDGGYEKHKGNTRIAESFGLECDALADLGAPPPTAVGMGQEENPPASRCGERIQCSLLRSISVE